MRGWRRWPWSPRTPPSWTLAAESLRGLLTEQASPWSQSDMSSLQALCSGLPLRPLPENRGRWPGVPHAPVRTPGLSPAEEQLALRNALRYFPPDIQELLAPEFAQELRLYGHIYMYRFCPDMEMRAYPVEQYPCRTRAAAAIMHMVMNNLDPAVAQVTAEKRELGLGQRCPVETHFPPGACDLRRKRAGVQQLGSVLADDDLPGTDDRGADPGHVQRAPAGPLPQQPRGPKAGHLQRDGGSRGSRGAGAPRPLTPHSGGPGVAPPSSVPLFQVIPNYSSRMEYEKLFAMGVTIRLKRVAEGLSRSFSVPRYGQMTAGSYCYIGPQGIVHGTVLTVLNAGRRYLGVQDLAGKVFVSSGLGGMSGAQAKAAVIVGCIGVVAEVDRAALMKRHEQGWLMEVTDSLDGCIERLREARRRKEVLSLGYHGNVVDLWERLVYELDTTGELLVDLGSDQTSCHNPFNGGYYPVQLGFAEAQSLMASDPAAFKCLVQESLRRHVSAINRLAKENFFFWDYGNAFLLEAQRAGADVGKAGADKTEFRYPSYVQHIMGDIFSQGFGPFRWVCTSGDPQDLAVTDQLATSVLEEAIADGVDPAVKLQYMDNICWVREAAKHRLVVGSQARILYSDQKGRVAIAVAFNQAIARGEIKAPVVLSRDHHDVSGTDSPFRETSNIHDGSAFCADMAVQNFVGDAFRGATWVALHNGGGVGWGEVINGGFGLVLDGTLEAEQKAKMVLSWDVSNGVARRCWSGNRKAHETICRTMEEIRGLVVTLPHEVADERVLQQALRP
ncbi:Urocanate hydratase [Camelus dromedarius]|uniref:urocanate hydratase n=1 Tax=Camelus dromedarius TaxID=9838 RepID=A0A5N4CYA9_CAMDR|nr:Urocanate hydratase [Camelus dromedarius]